MIVDQPGLDRFCAVARETRQIALDTEADSLHCYREKLCLVQIATPEFEELLDPLAEVPLQQFFNFIADKELIFHGADYDLRLFSRYGKFPGGQIFDTMLAARLVGESHVGLAALVEKFFGVALSKASQKANWAQRPLPQQMLNYALADVRYLIQLAAILRSRLEEKQRMPWLGEWIARTVHAAFNPRERDPSERWKIAGVARLAPRARAVVKTLWQWREAEAESWDRPPFHVMANSDMLRIAEQAVLGQAFSTPRFSAGRRKRFESALRDALEIGPEQWPASTRPARRKYNPEFSGRFDLIKARRDAVARELELEPALIAPKTALEIWAGEADSSPLMAWQRRLLDLPDPAPAENGK